MNFRRMPFQFNTSNPVDRQSELMRRFGVGDDKKFDESVTSATSGSTSPRLQCRLPKSFSEKESMRFEADNVDSAEWQPRVRVIPIQVEGQDDSKATDQKQDKLQAAPQPIGSISQEQRKPISNAPVKGPLSLGIGGSKEPSDTSLRRTHSIPVVVKGTGDKKMKSSSCINVPVQKESDDSKPSKPGNGPCASKSKKSNQICVRPDQESLMQITAVLKDFEMIKCEVDKFSGTQNDKYYYYLDEMMTRTMLKLDGIETYGNEEVRKARKAAIKTVQDAINFLESKVRSRGGCSNTAASASQEPMDSKTVSSRETRIEAVHTTSAAGPVAMIQYPSTNVSNKSNFKGSSENMEVVKCTEGTGETMTENIGKKDSCSQINKLDHVPQGSAETEALMSVENSSEIIV